MNIVPSYSSIQFFFNTSVFEDKAKKSFETSRNTNPSKKSQKTQILKCGITTYFTTPVSFYVN